jgi:hypothetical protein
MPSTELGELPAPTGSDQGRLFRRISELAPRAPRLLKCVTALVLLNPEASSDAMLILADALRDVVDKMEVPAAAAWGIEQAFTPGELHDIQCLAVLLEEAAPARARTVHP